MVTCCEDCGDGCKGGDPSAAWTYWNKTGIVSGGPYDSNQVFSFLLSYKFFRIFLQKHDLLNHFINTLNETVIKY